jgi:hypothetical protein
MNQDMMKTTTQAGLRAPRRIQGALLVVWGLAALGACGGGEGRGDPGRTLNAGVTLPNEGAALDAPPVDESVAVSGVDGTSDGSAPVHPGDVLTVRLAFEAPNGNVVGAGIRFGDDGPIRTVDIPGARGATEGVLEFDVQVPASVCDDIARICHDVRCYEFAVTDAGAVSVANINDIGLVCGGCDVPSCQDLLDCEPAATGTGDSTGAPGDTGPSVECQDNSECGMRLGLYGTLVCKDGACGRCESDGDCSPGFVCGSSGTCHEDVCDTIPVVGPDELDGPCTCPADATSCTDAPDCVGLCVGAVCKQDCDLVGDGTLCTTNCPAGTVCYPSSFGGDYCSS